MSAIAFLAGIGAGYTDGLNRKREQERQAAKDKMEQESHDVQMQAAAQQKSDRAALQNASAPVAVTQVEPNPDAGPWDAPATPVASSGYNVGSGATAKNFATQGLADAEAATQNSPDALNARLMALSASGNMQASQALSSNAGIRSSMAQAKVSEQALADNLVKRQITAMKVPEDMALFMSNSPADKMGGSYKAKVTYSPDSKKFSFDQVMPDGTVKPGVQSFDNTPQGFEDAKMTLAGYMTPEQRMGHAQWDKEFNLKVAKETSEGKERDAKVTYYNSLAGKADSWEPGGGKSKVDRMSEADKATLANLNKEREYINSAITKAQAEGSYDSSTPNSKALESKLATLSLKAAQVTSKYADDKELPDPLGIRKQNPSAKGKSPNGYASNAAQGQLEILQQEMDKATAALAKPGVSVEEKNRTQVDIKSLKKEMSRLNGSSATPSAAVKAPKNVTPQAIAASGISPSQSAPAIVAQSNLPTYEGWMAAKKSKDQIMRDASSMSPDRQAAYLSARLPAIDQAIQFNQDYKKY